MCSRNIIVLTVGIIGVALLVVGIIIGFSGALDGVINDRIKESMRLEDGTEQFERWKELPFPLQFKVYVFNVTNPDEIIEGGEPIVEEIGPWIYTQTRHKEDISYDEENDTLTYRQFPNFQFDATASAVSEDTEITILNMPMQGVLFNLVERNYSQSANTMWRRIFRTDEYFLTVPANEFFFDGYEFCVKSELNVIIQRFCNEIKAAATNSKTLTTDDEKITFALFAHKQNASDGEYKISAGNHDIHTLGEILSWEGLQYLTTWNGDNSTCNRIRGRDSSIYPPHNNKSSSFDIFNTDICRVASLKVTGTAEYDGVEGLMATMSADEMTNRGDKECYCIQESADINNERNCLPDGFADLGKCVGAPSIASFPHMLWADETHRNMIKGLKPAEDMHTSFIVIEPDTGTPLQGAKRMQFNMVIRPLHGIEITANLRRAIFPVIWVEEVFNLPEDLVQKLKDDYFSQLSMLAAITWSAIGVGIALILICIGYFGFKWIRK